MTKYFVMNASYEWMEATREEYDSAGIDPGLINNTATIGTKTPIPPYAWDTEAMVNINVRNIGVDSMIALVDLMQASWKGLKK